MKNIAIASLFICVSFSMESALVQHNRITHYLRNTFRDLPHNKDLQEVSDWKPKLFLNYFDFLTPLPKEIDHKYSSGWKHLSGSRNVDSSAFVPRVRNGDASALETLSINSEYSGIRSQMLNSSPGKDDIYEKGKNVNTSIRDAHNSEEAPDSSLLNEESPTIILTLNTGTRFGVIQPHHNHTHLSSAIDNTIPLITKPKTAFSSFSSVLESVPSSRSATRIPDSERIKKQSMHHLSRRAVASSANSCHSRHLHKCGEPVIQKFKLELDSATKCKIREDFLDCMVRQRKEGCFSADESLYTDENTDLLRAKIKSHLWSAHGCLLF